MKIKLGIVVVISSSLSACYLDDLTDHKPTMPQGLGYEQTVSEPSVAYPLPVRDYISNNNGSGRYDFVNNPIPRILVGIDQLWRLNLTDWRGGDATNGGANSSGLQTYGTVSSLVPFTQATINDSSAWTHNINYVEQVTASRTTTQAMAAYLDDRRSKNYSVIDGLGPLTTDYVAHSGAYTTVATPTSAQLNDAHYLYDNNDSIIYAGDYDESAGTALGAVAHLVWQFRQNSPASTSGPKYIFSTPRPWRMNSSGDVTYLGTTSYSCDNYTSGSAVTSTVNFDNYDSNVQVIPALLCARRTSSDLDGDGSIDESRAKDGAFPSGHTNAGYLAALAYAYAIPQRFSEMLYRASQLGENRIIAGMHSPVDVIGGRIEAESVAATALLDDAKRTDAETAYTTAQSYFGAQANSAGSSLYAYAHRTVTAPGSVTADVQDNNYYADHDAIKAAYRARLTYGFTQDLSLAGQAPVVPAGAETLLATRQPYLSAAQRRAVLATTEVDSGYPILDQSNGWGRLDYVTAADGYGAFNGDVNVYMNASLGGFNAEDWWRNDIRGAGRLTKSGSGTLTLSGSNSYSGGTLVQGGVLEAASESAFGSGTLYQSGGTVRINATDPVEITRYAIDDGTLDLVMDDDSSQLAASGTVYINGGALQLDFSHMTPVSGQKLVLIDAGRVRGRFSSVSASGSYQVQLIYTRSQVVATVQ
ncbi:autotransporter-associated beta strand repeat-containing protein [Celerinatantimonas sp. YJH-8]|uniref:autotransporter-associated beta strand repeat-containing protein n=1 Tax=Celerinatantimonas sp. YJH-8 TaxID=3228714 RepID=UPI0038C0B09D